MTRQILLWTPDYSELLLDADSYTEAEQFLRNSGHEWLPLTIEEGDWRWSGRMELEDGDIVTRSYFEYLKHTLTWPAMI